MDAGRRLAWLITRNGYRQPIVADVPRSRLLHFAWYGTRKKFLNYMVLRRAYRKGQLQVPGFPAALRIDPSSACNLRCPLCPTGVGETDRGSGVLSTNTFRQILDQFGDYVFILHLWGWGEPLLNNRLWTLVEMAAARRIGTEVSSHLSIKLSDADIDRVIRSGLTWLIVSIDATTADTYRTYRVGGNFQLATENLLRIVERKRQLQSPTPFVEWQFIPMRHNEHEIEDAKRKAVEYGVDGLRFKPVRIDKTRKLTFGGEIPAELEAWQPRDPLLGHRIDPATHAFVGIQCPFLWRSLTIHFDGSVAPCCETHLKEQDFAHISEFPGAWNNAKYQNARRIALGMGLSPRDADIPCYGCKVFLRPSLPTGD